MPELGIQLRTIREEKGLTLEDAGEELNIKSEDLKALEEEDLAFFPDRQFAWTVLEIYAVFLGMNKKDVSWEFSKIWPEHGPLKSLFRKPKRPKKEILATETAEIPEMPEISESPEISAIPEPLEGSGILETPEPETSETPEPETPEIPEIEYISEIEEIPEEVEAAVSVASDNLEEESKAATKKKFPTLAVAGVLVLAVVVFGVWKFVPLENIGGGPENGSIVQVEGEGEQPEQIPITEPGTSEEDVAEEAPDLEPDEVTTETVAAGTISVTVTTPNGECWVEVYADGEQIYYSLVPPDTAPLTFEAQEEMSVLIGDAAAARLTVNGEDLGVLGDRYVVIQKVFASEE